MDTLEQLIAKFDREYPDDMKLAREALQANPLKASDLIGIDIHALGRPIGNHWAPFVKEEG